MFSSRNAHPARRPTRRRILVIVIVVLLVTIGGLLAAIFIPFHSESKQIQVSSSSGTSASLSFPGSTWVTVHFSHAGSMPMAYWMNGPGGGMMFNHHGMMGGDTYSFWSSGGDYQCWAGYASTGSGMTPVWVNATWGIL